MTWIAGGYYRTSTSPPHDMSWNRIVDQRTRYPLAQEASMQVTEMLRVLGDGNPLDDIIGMAGRYLR